MDNRKIDGSTFSNMVISGANALNNDQQEINDLNVFPVPDGDTGANMSMTLENSAKELSSFDGSVSEVAEKAADTSLRSARGNSGAILSLFFRGMAKSLKGKDIADRADLAAAFESGTKEAYRAVSNPQEGTILTVMRACSEEAKTADDASQEDIGAYFEKIVKAAEETLDKTPEMLDALKEAQVVDAGGSGFVTMLKGMYSALLGRPVRKKNPDNSENRSAAAMADGSDEAIKFAYCTECIVDKDSEHIGEGSAEGLRSYIEQKGDSVVFVDDALLVKFHVHTNHPGKVIEQAIKYGSLTMVKVENMRLQHSGLVGSVRTEVYPVAEATKKYGFAAVCIGDGITSTFRDLGVDSIILGGQTMNPSTQDILNAVNRTPSEIVFLFPNNKNICMVAEQAKKLCTEKRLVVIPTVSVPQGIAAMMQFDESLDAEELEKNMNEACAKITSMAVTYAIKDTTVENREIKKGQAIGLVNGKIKYVGSTSVQCFRTMLKKLKDASYIVVFVGKDIAGEETTAKINELLREYVPNAECSVIDGGQPLYDFIVSAE